MFPSRLGPLWPEIISVIRRRKYDVIVMVLHIYVPGSKTVRNCSLVEPLPLLMFLCRNVRHRGKVGQGRAGKHPCPHGWR